MTEQAKPAKKPSVARALIVLVGLIGLLQLSFWSDQKSFEVEGPLRIVQGPQDTIYIQIDRKIVKVSRDGEVLHVLDLDADAAIPEHIADFFVENDGSLLIARRDSQLLQYYSPEGKLIKTHSRSPSALVAGDHFCKFSKDAATGRLYFADTSHHRIQIYGPDEKEINDIAVPSRISSVLSSGDTPPQNEQVSVPGSETHLRYPNGLVFNNDRLIATDTGNFRLLVFYPDGLLDRVMPTGEGLEYHNPFRVSWSDDSLYVIMRGPNFLGGKVAAFSMTSGRPRPFSHPKSIDPWDVFARPSDVLVADRESLSVLKFSPVGEPLGVFGQASLRNIYADRQVTRKTYQWLRTGSLAGMAILLLSLLVASRTQRLAHEAAGESLYKPIEVLQRFLGPIGGMRRGLLLIVIPGLGQAAAGRILRACTLLCGLLFMGAVAVYPWFQYQETSISTFTPSVAIMAAMLFYTAWMAVVLDGFRMNGKQQVNPKGFRIARVLLSLAAPLITITLAVAAQVFREMTAYSYPQFAEAIQTVFRSLMTTVGRSISPYPSTIPAALVFGWGGAAAGMFSSLAWQAKLGKNKVLAGIIAGFAAGMASWLISALLLGDRLGWMLYIQYCQGALIGVLAYLYFRRAGMPLLVVPIAVAGAWSGDLIRMVTAAHGVSLRSVIPIPVSSYWTGGQARLGFILLPAFFIHLAIWAAWNAAASKPIGRESDMTPEQHPVSSLE